MSTIKVDTIKNTSNVEVFTAKAWVNFNGTGTVAIRGSGNVTSITDNGTGDYTINFTNAMPDANYVITSISADISTAGLGSFGILSSTTPTTSSARLGTVNGSNSFLDYAYCMYAFHR